MSTYLILSKPIQERGALLCVVSVFVIEDVIVIDVVDPQTEPVAAGIATAAGIMAAGTTVVGITAAGTTAAAEDTTAPTTEETIMWPTAPVSTPAMTSDSRTGKGPLPPCPSGTIRQAAATAVMPPMASRVPAMEIPLPPKAPAARAGMA